MKFLKHQGTKHLRLCRARQIGSFKAISKITMSTYKTGENNNTHGSLLLYLYNQEKQL